MRRPVDASLLANEKQLAFANKYYDIDANDHLTVYAVFDAIADKNNLYGLKNLGLRRKRYLMEMAVAPGRGKPFFEKHCGITFRKKSIKSNKLMHKFAEERLGKLILAEEMRSLWEVQNNLPYEHKISIARLPASHFYKTQEWRSLRYKFFAAMGRQCALCNATHRHRVKLELDHIKPRVYFPDLAFCPDNLQVLCEDCHRGKGSEISQSWVEYSEEGCV